MLFDETQENIMILEVTINQYKVAKETFENAFNLYVRQNNLLGQVVNYGEIDFLMEMKQEELDNKERLVEACKIFIDNVDMCKKYMT